MTYMLLLNCALKLVEEIILSYDARSKEHQKKSFNLFTISSNILKEFHYPLISYTYIA